MTSVDLGIAELSEEIWIDLCQILEPFARGYYSDAVAAANQIAANSDGEPRKPFSVVATFFDTWDPSEGEKLESFIPESGDGEVKIRPTAYLEFYIRLIQGFMGSTDRSSLDHLTASTRALNQAGRIWTLMQSHHGVRLPGAWAVYWFRGTAYAALGAKQKALEDYGRAGRILSDVSTTSDWAGITIPAHLRRNLDGDRILVARYRNDRAMLLFDLGRLDEAEAEFEAATRLDSLSPYVHADYGFVLFWNHKEPQALSPMVRAYQLAATWNERQDQASRPFMSGRIHYLLGLIAYRWHRGPAFRDLPGNDGEARREGFAFELRLLPTSAVTCFQDTTLASCRELFKTSYLQYCKVRDSTRALQALVMYCDPLGLDPDDTQYVATAKMLWRILLGTEFVDSQVQLENQTREYLLPDFS